MAGQQGRRFALAAALLALGACASDPAGPIVSRPSPPPGVEYPSPNNGANGAAEGGEARSYDRRGFIEPLHMQGDKPVRVALLLPFTNDSPGVQKVASAMFDAAQLATFEAGDGRFLLIPKDTKGTPDGAAAAARSALADGAEVLLGPLFSSSVEAVAPVARAAEKPVIAFSSDLAIGGDGVYLMSFPPEIEIARVTAYAVENGIYRFGLLAPANAFGSRVSTSFSSEVIERGGTLVHEERYEQDPDKMLAPAKRLSRFAMEVAPPERRGDDNPESPSAVGAAFGPVQGYQAVMMPEQGTLLRALAPLLPYYNVDISQIKLLGVSSWNNPRLSREPALKGGWFAAPDPQITAAFKDRFEAAFGAPPPRLASLSYDATLLASRLAQNGRQRFDEGVIVDPNGYFGADGLFRLHPDGAIERGLAILEIQPDGIKVIDPAPKSFVTGF